MPAVMRWVSTIFRDNALDDIATMARLLVHDDSCFIGIANCIVLFVGRNVTPEVAEGILALITNCNLLMNKSRPAPPGVIRTHRNIDASFNPNPIFSTAASAPVDQLSNLGTSLANLNLTSPQTSNSFNLPGRPRSYGEHFFVNNV